MHKKLIDGLLYDTTKSQLIAKVFCKDTYSYGFGGGDCVYYYKTPNGRFFYVNEAHWGTPFRHFKNCTKQTNFSPLSEANMRTEIETLSKDKLLIPYEEIFGPIKEA